MVIDEEKVEQMERAVGGAHMMSFPGSGMRWGHERV
jgi:hypothetical protein